jgi:type IV secretory pathway protease TraF
VIDAAARSIRRDKDVDSALDRIERLLEKPPSRPLACGVGTAVLGEPERARDGDHDRIDRAFEPPIPPRGSHLILDVASPRARRFLIAFGVASAIGIGAVILPGRVGIPMLVIWEKGVSMPRGLYVYDHPPPASIGEVIVLREAPNWGRPYLMKRVVGAGGDRYCWKPEVRKHRLGRAWMPGPSPQAVALGIKVWAGCRQLRADEVVGYGNHPDSYDSRYFGPVTQNRIAGIYRLVLPLSWPGSSTP